MKIFITLAKMCFLWTMGYAAILLAVATASIHRSTSEVLFFAGIGAVFFIWGAVTPLIAYLGLYIGH